MIGIIGAMEEEVSKLKDIMTDVQVQEAAGMSLDVYKRQFHGRSWRNVRSVCGGI